MNNDSNTNDNSNYNEAEVVSTKRISAIWLVPFVAAIVAVWLAYQSYQESGSNVVLHFDSGNGIIAGKTPVIFQGINIGLVKKVKLKEGLSGVTVELEMQRQAEPLLKEDTTFWLVTPQISLAGVSGLDAIVSGNYISLNPGEDKKPAFEFTALKKPPVFSSEDNGLKLTLVTDELGSVSQGVPVLYRKITVGKVANYSLRPDQRINIHVSIDQEYKHLVNNSSRFWNASGIRVKGGLQNFELETGSIATLIAGGIAFETPKTKATTVNDGAEFELYASETETQTDLKVKVRFPSPEGIAKNSTVVKLRGIEVGKVTEIQFEEGRPNDAVIATLSISKPFASFVSPEARFWLVKPEISLGKLAGIETLLAGPHIEMDVNGEIYKGKLDVFSALPQIPYSPIEREGLRITLLAEDLGSLKTGTPLFYRKIQVGEVERVELKNEAILVTVFVEQEHAHRVRRNSKFWNASGIAVSAGLDGFSVKAESLSSVVQGGIAFTTPNGKTTAARPGEKFTLFEDFDASRRQEKTEIRIHFSGGEGLSKGTAIKYQGFTVGKVRKVNLNSAHNGIVVDAVLEPGAEYLAKEGSLFWVVKPELGLASTKNIETLVTGQYIAVRPGGGSKQNSFVGLDQPPLYDRSKPGRNLILTSKSLGSIKKGVKVLYRQIPVGEVTGYELANTADHVRIYINVLPYYVPLLRESTKFWNASGVAVNISPFSGASIRTNSFESLIEGGIAFATPNNPDMGAHASEDGIYQLHDKAEPAWLIWSPNIQLGK